MAPWRWPKSLPSGGVKWPPCWINSSGRNRFRRGQRALPEAVRVQHLVVGGSAAAVAAVEAIRSWEEQGAGGPAARPPVARRAGRSATRRSSIAVVSEEPYPPYARHLISYYLTGEREGDLLAYRPADFWARHDVQAYLGYRVVSLDVTAGEARLRRVARPRPLPVGLPDGLPDEPAGDESPAAPGEELIIGYEALLLATGGQPILPPISDPGCRAPANGDRAASTFSGVAEGTAPAVAATAGLPDGLSFFTTLDDAIRVRRAVAAGARRVVVVGGGLIGLQVAEALVRLGVKVEIVELLPRLLGPVLDEAAAARVETLVRRAGVGVWTGVAAAAVERDDAGRLTGVVLSDGRRLAADLVILAAGVRPRLELARAAGLACDRGVVLVRGTETSIPGIFAAGDVAQGWDMAAEALRPLPVWSNAVLQGREAGRQMAARLLGIDPSTPDSGRDDGLGGNGSRRPAERPAPGRPFPGLMLNAAHFFGLSVVSAGLPNPPPGDDRYQVVAWSKELSKGDNGRRNGRPTPDRSGATQLLAGGGWDYRKLVFREGRLVGLLAAGPSVAGAGAIAGLLRRGLTLNDPATGEALAEKWDWSVLPRSLRRELLWEAGRDEW